MAGCAGCVGGSGPATEADADADALLEVRVDPRVELMAVLFHMAGRDEYNMTRVTRWEAAVDSHFDLYAEQVELGFAWMPGLVALLGEYEADRDRWPTAAAFMPRVLTFFEDQAQQG